MAKRIYLHVGRHKSGTTQIQRFLKKNRPLLAEQKIDYPLPLEDDEAHHAAAMYLYDLDAAARRKAGRKSVPFSRQLVERGAQDIVELTARIKNHDGTSIISSEVFQHVQPSKTRMLVGETMTDVIIYLREQASYTVSAYCQNVVGDLGTRSFSEYWPHFVRSVNYVDFVARWVREFGASATTLRMFDRSALVASDIRRDFTKVLGLSDSDSFDYSNGPDVELFGGDVLEMLLRLNRTGTIDRQLRPAIVEEMRRVARARSDLGGKPKISNGCTREIQSYYAEQNKDLFVKFHVRNARSFTSSAIGIEAFDPSEFLDNPNRQLSTSRADEIIDMVSQSQPDVGACLKTAWNTALLQAA